MLNDAIVYSVLPAKDCSRLKTFLSEKLGLEPANEMMGMYTYEIGNAKLLIYESAYAGTNQATALSMEVGNLQQVVDDLTVKGVVFEHYDMPDTTMSGDIHLMDGSTMQSAWFKDTEGNIININQASSQ